MVVIIHIPMYSLYKLREIDERLTFVSSVEFCKMWVETGKTPKGPSVPSLRSPQPAQLGAGGEEGKVESNLVQSVEAAGRRGASPNVRLIGLSTTVDHDQSNVM